MATVRIQVRRGTSTQWTSTNPILAAGEMGVETNTNLFKFGNGTATWTALSYANNSDVAIGEISQDAINAALTMGTGLTKTYSDGANTITIAIDDTVWANRAYVAAAVSALSNTVDTTYIPLDDRGAVNGVASLNAQGKVPTSETDLTVMATRAYAEYLQGQDLTALLAHESDTTNIHGIANTANLVTSATLATEKADAINQAANSRDTAISAAIAAEATSRTAAIASEATSRTAAIASEATSRTAAIASEATSRATAIAAEATSREAAFANEATARATLATTLQGYADGAVSTHSTDTTNVHGIADTLLLATTANVATAKTEAISAAALAADSALGTHTSDTTNVHGIADTSLLATKSYADAIGTTATTALDLKAPKASPTFTGTVVLPTVTAGGSVIPSTDNTYDLGSPTKMWKDIYVGPGSLYVNGQKVLQDVSGAIVVSADVDENLGLRTSGSGNIELDPTGTGSVNIKGPLVVEAGANFSSADGEGIAFGSGIKSDAITSKTLNTDLSLSGNGTGKVYLNDNAEVNGNLVVGGNLTVSGTTTTVNSETIALADNIIDLNSNFTTGAPTENAGLRIIRGDSTAVQIRWNESSDKWEFTTDGTNYSVIAPTASPTFTGTVTIPAGASISGFAPLASPTFTGTVTVAAAGVAFTDGTQTKTGVPSITTIATTLSAGARTIAAGEQDKFIPLAGAVVITLPSTGYSTGQSIDFYQESGTGASFASTNSVVGTPGLKFRATNSVATAMKTSAGWLVFGDLSA